MSYHVYTTDGIVLSTRSVGEADRIYSILTRDLGRLKVLAIGVRKHNSKLRGSIEPFSFSTISLVKGKNYWRLTSAEFIKNISPLPVIARPLALIEKLVPGEESHPDFFDDIKHLLFSQQMRDDLFETRLVSHTLYHLGYLKKDDLKLDKLSLIKAINHGIESSHL